MIKPPKRVPGRFDSRTQQRPTRTARKRQQFEGGAMSRQLLHRTAECAGVDLEPQVLAGPNRTDQVETRAPCC